MFKGAIFDMDGVLVDSIKVHMEAFAEYARRRGVTVDTSIVMAMSGYGNDEIFEALFPREIVESVGAKRLGDEKEAIYREIYAPTLAPMRGLVDFLDALMRHGVKLAVGTSAPKANLDFVLDGLGLRPYFDALVYSDMVTRSKPDPEIYLRATHDLGLAAEECLVFEDAIAGVEAARAAGVKVVALSTSIAAERLLQTPGVVLAVPDFAGLSFTQLNDLLK